jgi:hypothetical protein
MYIDETVRVRAQSEPWSAGVGFQIRKGAAIATEIIFEELGAGVIPTSPTLSLSYEEAQTLMDDLWNCGLRPTEGTGSAGAMRATERHLEDMRNLVFEGKS